MCMFSVPVARVSKTQIYCADQNGGAKQVTVYSNKVALRGGKPTAMVLPVPCSAASREAADGLCGINVLDMSGAAANLFVDLKAMFPRIEAPSASVASFGAARSLAASTLEVHRSGSYRYSVVPSINDFARLDQTVFDLKAGGLEGVLMAHYALGYAFLACIIDRDAELVPIAYVHDKLPSKKLFIPTRHHHGTEGAGAAARAGRGDHGDWDHEIYTLGVADAAAGDSVPVPAGGAHADRIVLAHIARNQPFTMPLSAHASQLRKLTITGSHANEDLLFATDVSMRTGRDCTYAATGPNMHIQEWYMCATCSTKPAGARATGGAAAAPATAATLPPWAAAGGASSVSPAAGAAATAAGTAVGGRLGLDDGICAKCAFECHAGHDVIYAGRSLFFCDCGEGGKCAVSCKLMPEGVAVPPAAPVMPVPRRSPAPRHTPGPGLVGVDPRFLVRAD